MSADVAYYSSLGLLVSIECGDRETRNRLDDLYSACRVEPDRPADLELEIDVDETEASYEMRADGVPCARTPGRVELLEWVAWKINSAAVEHQESELVVHGAGLVRDGNAVMITGPSGAGKSTLAAALTLAGASYMGDDSLVVDGVTARLRSNPKPLSLDDSSRAALVRLATAASSSTGSLRARFDELADLTPPSVFGAVAAVDESAAPVLVVHARHRPGAPTSVTPLTTAETAELLADQSFNFPRVAPAGLRAVAALARRARGIELEFGDLAAAVGEILDVFADAIANPLSVDDPVTPARPGLVVELLSSEALIWDAGSQQLHRLSPTASAIWLACGTSTDPAVVAAAITRTMNDPPPDLRAVVTRCIEELSGLGLVGARPGQESTAR